VLDLNLDEIECPYNDDEDSIYSIASETDRGSVIVN